MRTSTLIVMGILLLAGVGSLVLLDAVLVPHKELIELARGIGARFHARGDLAEGSDVKLLRVEKDAAKSGVGLVLELTPSQAVLSRNGGLRALVRQAAVEAAGAYPSEGALSIRWFEVRLHLPQGEQRRAELARGADGVLGEVEPPLPARWPLTPATPPPPAPSSPSPGTGTEGPR